MRACGADNLTLALTTEPTAARDGLAVLIIGDVGATDQLFRAPLPKLVREGGGRTGRWVGRLVVGTAGRRPRVGGWGRNEFKIMAVRWFALTCLE